MPASYLPSPTRTRSPETPQPPIRLNDTQATRDLREATLKIDAIDDACDALRANNLRPPFDLSAAGTLAALDHVPQYDRTHVPGCVCKPAIAGGACCPSNVGGLTLQQMTSSSCAPQNGIHALGLISSLLGCAGIYSGVQVIKGAKDAQKNLMAVDAHARQLEGLWGLRRGQLEAYQKLPHNQMHVAQTHAGLLALRRDLRAAQQEQRFYTWVPGRLQIGASLGVLVAAVPHLTHTGIWLGQQALWGGMSAGLFVVYGLAMAGKNVLNLSQGRNLTPFTACDNTPEPYRSDYRQHLAERRIQALQASAAWLGVSVAASLGAAITLGSLALPYAWVLTGAITLVAGAAAMWSNSCSRYAPHLPVSPHMHRSALVNKADRARLYGHLHAQQAVITRANAAMQEGLSRVHKLHAAYETAFRPQCGPEAFTVLANEVAARWTQKGESHARSAQDDYITQLTAVLDYCRIERLVLAERIEQTHQAQYARRHELADFVDPCCEPMMATANVQLARGAPNAQLFADAAALLEQESRTLVTEVNQLAVLDKLIATCEQLQSAPFPTTQPVTPSAQASAQQWLAVRINVLQHAGLLRDALDKQTIDGHGDVFKTRITQHMWPLGNVYIEPGKFDAVEKLMAPTIESMFIHAFFNPRRIEAEMDYLLEMQASESRDSKSLGSLPNVPYVAPGASSATCCAR
jgi:hypothetical protein